MPWILAWLSDSKNTCDMITRIKRERELQLVASSAKHADPRSLAHRVGTQSLWRQYWELHSVFEHHHEVPQPFREGMTRVRTYNGITIRHDVRLSTVRKGN